MTTKTYYFKALVTVNNSEGGDKDALRVCDAVSLHTADTIKSFGGTVPTNTSPNEYANEHGVRVETLDVQGDDHPTNKGEQQ